MPLVRYSLVSLLYTANDGFFMDFYWAWIYLHDICQVYVCLFVYVCVCVCMKEKIKHDYKGNIGKVRKKCNKDTLKKCAKLNTKT